MEPTKKATPIENLLREITGSSRVDTIRGSKCVFCSTPDLQFKDELSRREYRISGICQRCQDEMWPE